MINRFLMVEQNFLNTIDMQSILQYLYYSSTGTHKCSE